VRPKKEGVDLSEYESYTDAVLQIGHFLGDVYRHERIHWSLGCLTSVEFESHWRNAQNGPVLGGQYTRMELQRPKTLTDYTAAREKLLARILTFLTNDARFVAAWLTGSFGRCWT